MTSRPNGEDKKVYNAVMYRYFELILAMGTAWALSGILRFTLPEKKKFPDSPYAVAVISVFLLSILDNLLRPNLLPMGVLRVIYPFSRLSYFLIGPALWFYVRILLKENFRVRVLSLLHLLPFLMWFVYLLIYPAAIHPKIPFGENTPVRTDLVNVPDLPLSFFWDISKNLSRLIYSGAILILLSRNKKQLPDRVSSINRRNTLSWLGNLIIFYTGIYLINSLLPLFLSDESQFFQIAAAIGRSLPAVLFVFLFTLFSEDQIILAYSEEPGKESRRGGSSSQKYEKSGMSEKDSKSLYIRLCKHIEQTKAYLDPELTLDMLADQTGETRHRLSEVINRESGMRFFSYINGFRLKEFRDAVKHDRFPDYTILAVAFECGFRSSSAFYSLVKKELGMTPKSLVRVIREESIKH